jgi:hypothetical protein
MQESSTVQKPHLFLQNKAATQLTKKGDLKPQKKGSPDLNRGASAKFPILAAVFRVQKLDCICKKKPTQF